MIYHNGLIRYFLHLLVYLQKIVYYFCCRLNLFKHTSSIQVQLNGVKKLTRNTKIKIKVKIITLVGRQNVLKRMNFFQPFNSTAHKLYRKKSTCERTKTLSKQMQGWSLSFDFTHIFYFV